MKPALLN